MFPSVPPLKVVASFSLSMVHAGLILSQLSVSPAGNQKDDGAERAPPVPSARTDADQTEAEPPAAT